MFFFLPSITDRCEEINQHMKCFNIHPFDLNEKEFGDGFQPHLLDITSDKKKMTASVVDALKKIALKYPILTLSKMPTVY